MAKKTTVKKTTRMVCRYLQASGKSFDDCAILGTRFPDGAGNRPDDSDYWLLVNQPRPDDVTFTYTRRHLKNHLTGIWRSPSGNVYVADATLHKIYLYRDLMKDAPPRDYLLPGAPEAAGVWGLDDKCVFSWGTQVYDGTHRVYRFDGKSWDATGILSQPIARVHGIAPNLVYAAGAGGMVARWDGKDWKELTSPTREDLTDIHVASKDEIYAVGAKGCFLQGTGKKWQQTGASKCPLVSVAKFKGEVYAGAGKKGLWKRASDGSIALYGKNTDAGRLEAGKSLLITEPTEISGTADNQEFSCAAKDMLAELTAEEALLTW